MQEALRSIPEPRWSSVYLRHDQGDRCEDNEDVRTTKTPARNVGRAIFHATDGCLFGAIPIAYSSSAAFGSSSTGYRCQWLRLSNPLP